MRIECKNGLSNALKNGMTPEEMQTLFNGLLKKADTKEGGDMFMSFATGIGMTKHHSLEKKKKTQLENQNQIVQEKSFQYIYK